MSEEIPLFPLNAVLFPGGPLPLLIFEARYLDLVSRCLQEGSGFGVVLIREGQEAGGFAVTFDVGTYARIVDFSRQRDGLLGILARGERRFRILSGGRRRTGCTSRTSSGCPRRRRWLCRRSTRNSAPRWRRC